MLIGAYFKASQQYLIVMPRTFLLHETPGASRYDDCFFATHAENRLSNVDEEFGAAAPAVALSLALVRELALLCGTLCTQV